MIPARKKYKYAALKSSLLKFHKLQLREQKEELEKEFYKWKGDNPQIDDVLVLGLNI